MRLDDRQRKLSLFVCTVLALAVFVVDSATPTGIAVGVLYSNILLVCLLVGSPRTALRLAVACTALLIVGHVLAPDIGVPEQVSFFNRALSILMLWSTTLLGLVLERTRRELEISRGQLARANAELARLARSDHLTRIPNRRYFDEQLQMEFRRAMREDSVLSLMMIDIDFFKALNDAAGHQAGDECLFTVAQTIARSLRRPSDFVARYGGEEFGLLLPGTDLDGAIERAETIRKQIEQLRVAHPEPRLNSVVTISIGVASVHPARDGAEPRGLIESADRALYDAKEQGRNCVRAYNEPRLGRAANFQ